MKTAVLGLGGMGSTVIEHLRGCGQVKEILGYDIKEDPAVAARRSFGIRASTNLGDILSDRSVRLVFITASNQAHKELALKSLEAGKSVMCEKPVANTLEDAEEVVSCAERAGAFLQIGFELRYSKLYTRVKAWIDEGLLGDVINTHCTYIMSESWGRDSWRCKLEQGGSMFGEKLSHYVDLTRWWTGSRVKDVFAVCAPNAIPYYEVHDNFNIVYRFENGAAGGLTFMMAPASFFEGDPLQNVVSQQSGDGHELRYIVCGTRGAAETDVFGRRIKRWAFSDRNTALKSELVENITWPETEDHFYFHNTADQTRDIVRRVAEGLPPKVPASDALETMRLCFAADRSAASGNIESCR